MFANPGPQLPSQGAGFYVTPLHTKALSPRRHGRQQVCSCCRSFVHVTNLHSQLGTHCLLILLLSLQPLQVKFIDTVSARLPLQQKAHRVDHRHR